MFLELSLVYLKSESRFIWRPRREGELAGLGFRDLRQAPAACVFLNGWARGFSAVGSHRVVANVVEAIIAHEDGRNVIGGGLAERHLSVLC